METVKERLICFIEHKGLSKNKFEKICGLSTRYVSNISQSIQPDTLKKISLNFPDLNTGWLLTGDGEMIKDDHIGQKETDATISDVMMRIIAEKNRIIDQQFEIIRLLRERVAELEGKGGISKTA